MSTTKSLEAQVREVLLQHWDPIGVAGIAAAQDEYDQYAKPIAAMTIAGATIDELSTYLVEIETDRMGLKSDHHRAQAVARKLREIARTR